MKALLLHWRMWRYARQSPSLRPGTAERYRDELARLKPSRHTYHFTGRWPAHLAYSKQPLSLPIPQRGGASMASEQARSWFHWNGGVFFRRAEDGTVEIGEGPDFDNVTVKHRVAPGSWASIMASVGFRGEDHITFNEAQRFHMGQPVVLRGGTLDGERRFVPTGPMSTLIQGAPGEVYSWDGATEGEDAVLTPAYE